jgi:hypothetical protein
LSSGFIKKAYRIICRLSILIKGKSHVDYLLSAGAGAASGAGAAAGAAAEDIGAWVAGAVASGAGAGVSSVFFLQPAVKAKAITRHSANEISFFIDVITSFLF